MQKAFLCVLICIISIICRSQGPEPKNVFKISVEGIDMLSSEVLSLYIQHKSISGNEKEAGEWLKGICKENGLFIAEFGNNNGNFNFAASLYPLGDSLPNIILLNHIDVVPEGHMSCWDHDPYAGLIEDSKVWGRGAFDNKGTAMMQLFSLLEFKIEHNNITSPSYNITFLSVCCEEIIGEGGVKYVVDNHFRDLNPAMVLGEGATELSTISGIGRNHMVFGISVAHKRPLWLELKLEIPSSCHGSVTPLSYANKEMTIALAKLVNKKPKPYFSRENKEILKSLGRQERGFKKFVLLHPGLFKPFIVKQLRRQPEIFALFTNTITLTSVDSKNPVINKVTDEVWATLDCRLLPDYPQDKFLDYVEETLDNENIEIKIIKELEPLPVSDTSTVFYRQLEMAIEETYAGAGVFPILLPNYNDVGYFRLHGVPGYSIIPVIVEEECLRCIHAGNEHIPLTALQQGIEVYRKFLENLMLN